MYLVGHIFVRTNATIYNTNSDYTIRLILVIHVKNDAIQYRFHNVLHENTENSAQLFITQNRSLICIIYMVHWFISIVYIPHTFSEDVSAPQYITKVVRSWGDPHAPPVETNPTRSPCVMLQRGWTSPPGPQGFMLLSQQRVTGPIRVPRWNNGDIMVLILTNTSSISCCSLAHAVVFHKLHAMYCVNVVSFRVIPLSEWLPFHFVLIQCNTRVKPTSIPFDHGMHWGLCTLRSHLSSCILCWSLVF